MNATDLHARVLATVKRIEAKDAAVNLLDGIRGETTRTIAVRVLDLVVNAHRDPTPIGDYDPVAAAIAKADLTQERFADVISRAGGGPR